VTLWFIVFTYPDKNLHIIACDVGQGDGFLIYQGTMQIIVDGGPGNKMTKCLDRYLPFWDKNIELVFNTHPQLDHYEGLIDVFKSFKVKTFAANSLNADAPEYQVLKSEVQSKGTKVINPVLGTKMTLGSIKIDILHPSVQFLAENTEKKEVKEGQEAQVLGAYTSSLDPNNFSIMFTLDFGSFDALFTGDADEPEEDLVSSEGVLSDIEYLKVPHHGSKNGLTKDLLDKTTPEIAVISDGKKNRYGHPHKEILEMLNQEGVKILRTDEMGDVEVASDGERWWVKNPKSE